LTVRGPFQTSVGIRALKIKSLFKVTTIDRQYSKPSLRLSVNKKGRDELAIGRENRIPAELIR